MLYQKYFILVVALASLSFATEQPAQKMEKIWSAVMTNLGKGALGLANAQMDSIYTLAINAKDSINLEKYYDTAGEMAYFSKDYEKCLRLSKANAELMKDSDNYGLRSLIFSRIGNVQRHFGNLDSSYLYAYKAKALLSKIDNEKNYSPILYVYNDLAMLHSETSRIDSSIYYYLELLRLTPAKDSFRLQTINTNLSSVFKTLNNPQKQKFYLDRALDYCQSDRLIGSRAKVMAYQAAYYRTNGEFQKAERLINESIALQIDHNKRVDLEDSYLIKSSILIELGKYQAANETLKIIASAENSKNKEVAASFLLNKMTIAIETNNKFEVSQLMPKAIMVVEDLKMLRPQRKLYAISAKHFKNEQQYKLANEMLEKYTKVNDSLTNLQSIQIAKNLESEFEFEKNNLRISNLEKQEILNKKDLARQRYLLLGGGLALGLISFLSFFLFGKNKKIKNQKGIIEKSLAEKDTLLREIHHRVKNNLQLVSSLLTLQSRSITDQSAIAAINDGKARVRSMALIHQNLYNRENLTGISVKEYIQKLCGEIFNTYNIESERIILDLNIQELELDVDTVVPLGLIINELLTNSLKYAFPNDQKGSISINLAEKNEKLEFELLDNGVGMPEELFHTSSSFGNRLVKILTEQLEGDLSLNTENGTEVKIIIDQFKKAA